jgi:dihydroxy-acid dehydratase
MLKATGLRDADLERPLVAVLNTWTEVMPCNLHLRDLAARVKDGVRAAGGTPIEFNTIAVSDGISMGTEGMRASLVSREVIADSMELAVPRPQLRRRGRAGRLRQGPSRAQPSPSPASISRRCCSTADPSFPAASRAATSPSRTSSRRSAPTRRTRCPIAICSPSRTRPVRAPAPAAGSSPPTPWRWRWPSSASRRWAPTRCRPWTRKRAPSPSAPAPRSSTSSARDVRARTFVTRASLENAIAAVAASGGSTNGVLHLLAIARAAGVALSIDDFDTVAARTPVLCDLKPGGRFTAVDLHRAGGVAVLARNLLAAGLASDVPTVSGRSLAEEARDAVEAAGQQVILPRERALKPTGGLAILRGSLAPEGCVVKLAGHGPRAPRGPGARLRR